LQASLAVISSNFSQADKAGLATLLQSLEEKFLIYSRNNEYVVM
jgi:hypothetical protein